MLGPQQKQKQLTSMVNDLTSIKKQLHQLMTPSSEERTTDSQLKSQYHQFKESTKHKEPQRSDRLTFQHNLQFKGSKSPSGIYHRNPNRYIRQGIIQTKDSPIKNGKQFVMNSSKKSPEKNKYIHALNRQSKEKISSERMDFLSKEHGEKLTKNAFTELAIQTVREEEPRNKERQFSRERYSSQRDLHLANKLNVQLVDTTHFQKESIRQQKILERHFIGSNRSPTFANPPQSKSPKRLIRMKSDLIENSHTLRHHNEQKIDLEWKSSNLRYFKEKIKELQEENMEKQEIIHLLEAELKEIQANFVEMKHTITKIIKIGSGNGKNNGEVDITTALKEIVRDLSLQKEELKRLTIDGQTWRKLNFQQSLQIKSLNEQLSKFTSINETISQLKEQNNTCKDQLINLSSKLEVSNNENRIKDEFIVKFLMGRGLSAKEDEKIEHLMEILANYLKNCSYPNNKLLDKLNQEQQEIKKLRALLQKDRKNSA